MMQQKKEKCFNSHIKRSVMIEGIIIALFGIIAMVWPNMTLGLIAMIFGIFVLVWGVVNFIKSFLSIGLPAWWLELIFSIIAIALGVFLIRDTNIGITFLIVIIGTLLVARGLVDLAIALLNDFTETKELRLLHFILGLLGVLAGIIILSQPIISGKVLAWMLGIIAVVAGIAIIVLSFRVPCKDKTEKIKININK